MKRIIQIILIILFIIGLAYFGACVYGNYFSEDVKKTNIPNINEAKYSLLVKNTGTVIYSNNVEQFGNIEGDRTFVLTGYWERSGSGYNYINDSITIQENYFGKIIINKREINGKN